MLANFGGNNRYHSSSQTRIGFGATAPRFGGEGNRSTTNSVSRGRNNENDFGIWGKKTT